LVGYYVEQAGHSVTYVDPLADDQKNVVECVDTPAVFLWAHNRRVTYEYTGDQEATKPYCEIKSGSVIVDPWRQLPLDMKDIKVVHYGNTRNTNL
jgi:hypothetical protein